MSQTPPQPSPPSPATQSPAPAPQPPPAATRPKSAWPKQLLKLVLLGAAAVVGLLLFIPWIIHRRTHSITDDGFVESHIVNVAPEMVSGRIVRFLVDENDSVKQGEIIAEIDPVPYRDRVLVAHAKLDAATAELKRQEADLARLRTEIPIQIEIARRTLAVAEVDHAKAEQALKLTRDDVDKAIDEAQAAVSASQADLLLSEQEFDRFTGLYRQEAVPLRRSQEVTRSRDAAK